MTLTTAPTRTYRVVKLTTIGFGNDAKTTPETVWEGTDIKELSRKFPPSQVFGADPLGHSEIEDGHICVDYRFERVAPDGSSEEIDDFRRRITPMSALERAIDAENRRLFPGDFIVEDGDEPYDGDYDPYDCRLCFDRGCAFCEPGPACCMWCGRLLQPTETDLCALCQTDIEEMNRPSCCACGLEHTDPTKADGDICQTCNQYYTEYYSQETDTPQPGQWYRQILNRLFGRR